MGIDPGFDRIGWAVGQLLGQHQLNLLSYGLVETNKKADLFTRYAQIEREFNALTKEFQVDEAALETLVFFRNYTTVIPVAQARGIILSSLIRHQVKIFEYSPPQIKMSVTGFGRADKAAVAKMVRLQLHLDEQTKIIDDTYDALAVLLTHLGSRGLQQQTKV
ncbi:crossover junction endodeoxyribonuclease RuvC [bacterium]|nr:crossover junction endodeoxyribonuclease RuvC [bacterium]